MLHSTGSWKFRKWEIDWANGELYGEWGVNIKGNHYRLLTIIHYRYKRIYIQEFFTHAAYDRWTRTYRQG